MSRSRHDSCSNQLGNL